MSLFILATGKKHALFCWERRADLQGQLEARTETLAHFSAALMVLFDPNPRRKPNTVRRKAKVIITIYVHAHGRIPRRSFFALSCSAVFDGESCV